MNEALLVLIDIRKHVEEACMLARHLPRKREMICGQVRVLVELALESVEIMEAKQ